MLDFHTAPKLSCDESQMSSEEIPADSGDDYEEEKPKKTKKAQAPVKAKKSPIKSSPLVKKYEKDAKVSPVLRRSPRKSPVKQNAQTDSEVPLFKTAMVLQSQLSKRSPVMTKQKSPSKVSPEKKQPSPVKQNFE